MASLKLSHIYKVYPNGTKAVKDFCMDINDKEFIVFVGPSGCGKSTTLRMIAGLEDISAGELRIGDAIVNDMEPKDRDIAMVFQNYALYPHMTVYDNMAFGLRLRRIDDVKRDKEGNPILNEKGETTPIKRKYTKEEIDVKVKEAANILGITEYLDRKPKEMSGGQRQRVALGRAIVREPKVFLLDEPLSNLDAKLRTAMRSEISKLHHKLQTTFIYVTHDQVEAMTMGTRIVVMKDGYIQQIDSPRNLYRFPSNIFVAGFIGTPQMNFFRGKLVQHGDKVTMTFDGTQVSLEVPTDYFKKANRAYLDGSKSVVIGIRAEHISVDTKQYPFKAKCRVSHYEELGTDCQVYADFNIDGEDTVAESPTKVIVKAPAGSFYDVGEIIEVSLDLTNLHVFDAETEQTIAPRIPQNVVVESAITRNIATILGAEVALPKAIQVENGVYKLTIPTTAIKLGGTIPATFVEEEDVSGQRLVHLKVADRILFALVDKDANIDKKTKIGIDFTQVAFERDGAVAVKPLAVNNIFTGKVSKHNIVVQKEVNGKMKSEKDLAFSFDILGSSFESSRNLVARLVSGAGQNVFTKELEFACDAGDIKIAELLPPIKVVDGEEKGVKVNEGIAAKVVSVLDYDNKQFAVCKVQDKIINVQIDKEVAAHISGEEIHLVLEADKLAVTDTTTGIRLA